MIDYNLRFGVPKHKIVTISDDQGSIIGDHPLLLNDDYSIKASSKYGQLWEASPSNLMSLMSSSFGTPSGQFALQGAQIWQSTDPITISVNVDLEMDNDPYEDVIVPTLTLMKTCVPSIADGKSASLIEGAFEGIVNQAFGVTLKTLIPPGPNLQDLVVAMSTNNSRQLTAHRDGRKGLYTVRIGWCTLNRVAITSVEPTFSKEVASSPRNLATTGSGYGPVRASLAIEMTTLEVATTNMLDEMGGRNT
jgi:hypothetical protein